MYPFTGLVSDYIRRQRRQAAASLAIGSDEDDDDDNDALPRTSEMERVRRAVRRQRDEEEDHQRTSDAGSSFKLIKKTCLYLPTQWHIQTMIIVVIRSM
jgi:hypothetical protein